MTIPPSLELPTFEGERPEGVKNSITGKATGVHRPLRLDDEVTLIITCRVKKVSHDRDADDFLWRNQTLAVESAALFTDDVDELLAAKGVSRAEVIRAVRAMAQRDSDALHGRVPLPLDGYLP